MILSPIFHRECDPIELDDAFLYVVFSCLQWKSPNLEALPQAAKQRFAVLYHQPLDETSIMETLERAHILGAMSGVKLVAVHKDAPYIFLSHEVASNTFSAIELLWTKVREMDRNQRLTVDFGSEAEIHSGRSDYAFWRIAREALNSEALGIEQYQIYARDLINDDVRLDAFNKETEQASADKRTPELVQLLRESYYSSTISAESGRSPKRSRRENKCFSLSEREAISNAVASTGNLRDACLYALMLEQFRVSEISEMQACNVKTSHKGVTVTVRVHKTLSKVYRKVLPAYAGALIVRYIGENGISGEDLLFPSRMDVRRSMSLIAASTNFWSWLSNANIKQTLRSSDLIRQSLPPRD